MTIKKLNDDNYQKYKKIVNLTNIYSFICSNITLNRIPIMQSVEVLKIVNCKLYSMAHYYINLKELNC